jgi:hypothetical protein
VAKIRLYAGAMPFDAGDIEPSVNGSAPVIISSQRGSVSPIVPFILALDTVGYTHPAGLTILSPNPRIRWSTGGAWSLWGADIVIDSAIGSNGVPLSLQAQAYVGDPASTAIKLSIPQDGIVAAATGTLLLNSETSDNSDVATLAAIAKLLGLNDAPTNLDSVILGYGGSFVQMPAVADAATNTDSVTLYLVNKLAAVADNASNSDAVTLKLIATIGTVADNATNADASSMTTAAVAPATIPNGTYYLQMNGATSSLADMGYGVQWHLVTTAPSTHSIDLGVYPTYPNFSLGGIGNSPVTQVATVRIDGAPLSKTARANDKFVPVTNAGNFIHPSYLPFAAGATVTMHAVIGGYMFFDEELQEDAEMSTLVFGSAGSYIVVS